MMWSRSCSPQSENPPSAAILHALTVRHAQEPDLAEVRHRLEADPDLLKGILTNLLENAAEAAGEGE